MLLKEILFIQQLKYPPRRSSYSIKSKLLTGEMLNNVALTNLSAFLPLLLCMLSSCWATWTSVISYYARFFPALYFASRGPHSLPDDNPPSLKASRGFKHHLAH